MLVMRLSNHRHRHCINYEQILLTKRLTTNEPEESGVEQYERCSSRIVIGAIVTENRFQNIDIIVSNDNNQDSDRLLQLEINELS